MLQKQSRNFGLDALRALAIVLVLLSHTTFLLFHNNIPLSVTVIRTLGAVGVDLFFVLSGYLIGGILFKHIINNTFDFQGLIKFLKRRWFRTLPVYFMVLILNILLLVILGDFQIGERVLLYFPFLQNFTTDHPDFFTEAWSLSIEEYAYLFLPFIFFTILNTLKKGNRKMVFILSTLGVILVLTSLKWIYFTENSVANYSEWSGSFRKVVIYRLDSIYYGFIMVYLVKVYPVFMKKYKSHLFVLGSLLFLFLHIAIFYFNLQPETHLWFYVFIYLQGVCFSLSMLFPLAIRVNTSQEKLSQIIYFISTRSYSIYLVNYSLVLLTIERVINLKFLTQLEKTAVVISFLLITLFISNLLYSFLEKPILRFRDRKFPR